MGDVSLLFVAACVAATVGAALQSATGFGFAVVAAPVLFASVRQERAIGLLLVLGIEIALLTLATERRRPQPLVRPALVVLAWAAPAAVLGVVVLRALDAVTLQLAVTVGVAATLVVRRRAARRAAVAAESGAERREPRWAAPVTGLVAGALTTATNTNGPPVLVYLLGRGAAPGPLRDTLTLCLLGFNAIGVLALVVTGTSRAVPTLTQVAVLVPLVLLGHIAGRPIFARLAASGRYEPVLTGVLVVAVGLGLVTVV
jgi:uncharacterized membrane protein YfcA